MMRRPQVVFLRYKEAVMDERSLYYILLAAVFVTAAIVFILLFLITAPYGRHGRPGWGPALPPRLGWIIMELPAFLVIALCFFASRRTADPVSIAFICIWELHYVQRTCIFPLRMRGASRRFPILLILFAIVFNSINGYLNGSYLFNLSPPYGTDWFLDPRFIIGTALFLAGYAVNLHSDHVLRTLRKPGETGYKIPRGGFFRYVSCPNYFGELVEWTGWTIATWSLAGLAFAVFTAANLVPRARSNHEWYRKTFPDYPAERKRVIPFVY